MKKNALWTYHRTAAGEMKSCQVDWYTRQQSIYSSSITDDHKTFGKEVVVSDIVK